MTVPDRPGEPEGGVRISRELRVRIGSGVLVAAIGLFAVYWGAAPFAILLTVVASVMSWEWGRLVWQEAPFSIVVVHVAAVLVASVLTSIAMSGAALAALAGGTAIVAIMSRRSGRAALSSLGVGYTGLPVVALGFMRNDPSLGFLAVLFILLAVIATDTAAFFAGRGIGGAKLWPSVSPNKTWSGLLGGITAGAIMGLVFPLLTGSGLSAWLAPLGLSLGFVAQAGDLAESALKRHAGVKDASDLIPGHGGFMDRMDGVVTASIFAALTAYLIEPSLPGRALLYGS